MTAGDLDAWRGRHKGATIIVCGCGASLAGFTPPPGVITIGVNDMGRAFDPDYLLVLNGPAQFSKDRFDYIRRSRARAIFSHLDLGLPAARMVRFRLGRQGGTDVAPPGKLHYARNSPFTAVHLAALMSAARIGLIGVDFTQDHFFAATGTHPLTRTLPRIEAEYAALAADLRARGIPLVNLSAISCITTLPRSTVDNFCKAPPMPRNLRPARPLTLAIPRQRAGAIGTLLDALATSALSIGHNVRRGPPIGSPADTVAVVWNGRNLRWPGPVIYCEHGWLPRAAYQISPKGINADSHAAPFAWDGVSLNTKDADTLDRTFARLRQEAARTSSGTAPKKPFLLVPLQMEYDTNLTRHAPPTLRRMQALIDHISAADPPFPLVFKQHPADLRRGARHLKLRPSRRGDVLWPHGRGDVHTLLASGRCRGIVSINSNVVHDGLLYDVPSVVLGRNLWPQCGITPFLTALPDDWSALTPTAEMQACRSAYAMHLLRHQWSLADARDPAKLSALLESMTTAKYAPEAPRQLRPRPAPAPRPRIAPGPEVNIYARNRGWRFEEIKSELLTRARARGIAATASDRPQPGAAAWIAIRTTEAGLAPDPARTLVQVHDLASGYGANSKRAALARAGHIQLTHAAQIEHVSICPGLDRHRLLRVIAPGTSQARAVTRPNDAPFTVGWFGRTEQHEGRDRYRPDLFVSALCGFGSDARALLAGEQLEPYCDALRQAGLMVSHLSLRSLPMSRWAERLTDLDALVLTGDFDPAPQMLFDALAAGVPVIARPVGWATDLLTAAPKSGFLADGAEAMAEALQHMFDDLPTWRAAAPERHSEAQILPRNAWLDQALDAALSNSVALSRVG